MVALVTTPLERVVTVGALNGGTSRDRACASEHSHAVVSQAGKRSSGLPRAFHSQCDRLAFAAADSASCSDLEFESRGPVTDPVLAWPFATSRAHATAHESTGSRIQPLVLALARAQLNGKQEGKVARPSPT